MANTFTTVITDPNIVNKLPDLSLLDRYYDENSTVEDLKALVDSSVLRQKLQHLLEFKLEEEVIKTLQDNLMDAFIASQDEDAVINKINDSQIEVNGKLYTVYLHSFGDGIFSNDHFNNLFFTTDVFDEIFKQNDKYFNAALYKNKKFWDILLSNDELWSHMKENYSDNVIEAYKNHEIAYVKIAIKESNQTTFADIDDIPSLIDRNSIFTIILSEDKSKAITDNSRYGQRANALYLAETNNFDEFNTPEILEKIENDAQLREAVSKLDIVEGFDVSSDFYKKIVNNDTLLGMVISDYYSLDDKVSFSQILYTEEYANIVKKMINDKRILKLMDNSDIIDIVKDDFFEKYYKYSYFNNTFIAENLGDKIIGVAVKDSGVKVLEIVFPDETSDTFDVPVTDLGVKSVAPVIASNQEIGLITFDKEITFTSDDLFLLFSEFRNKNFADIIGYKKHLFGITLDGEIVDSKFYINKKINIENYKQTLINNNATIVESSDDILVLGNLEYDAKSISSKLNENIDTIKTIILIDKKVLIVDTNKNIKEVTDSDLVDSNIFDEYVIKDGDEVTDSAKDNGIRKVLTVGDYIIVLDDKNKMWYKEGDSIILTENVDDILYGQDSVTMVSGDNKKALVEFANKLRTFTYTNNI